MLFIYWFAKLLFIVGLSVRTLAKKWLPEKRDRLFGILSVGSCVGKNQIPKGRDKLCHLRTGLLLFFGVRELRLRGGNRNYSRHYYFQWCS
jgi:hypothetical protein